MEETIQHLLTRLGWSYHVYENKFSFKTNYLVYDGDLLEIGWSQESLSDALVEAIKYLKER